MYAVLYNLYQSIRAINFVGILNDVDVSLKSILAHLQIFEDKL